MARIIVRHPFKFAHGGHRVEEFEAGVQAIDTSAECAELAIAEGWADDADKLEAERLAAEEAAKAEAERLAAEQASQAEAERLAAEQAAQAEADCLAGEQAAGQPAEEKAAPAAPANKDAAPKRRTKTAA